jgi:hypothetical protein
LYRKIENADSIEIYHTRGIVPSGFKKVHPKDQMEKIKELRPTNFHLKDLLNS